MVRVVPDGVSFAAAVRIDQIGGDQIAGFDGLAVAHRKWRIAQRTPDRPPYIDDLHAPLQQFLGLIGKMFANAIGA